MKIFKGTMKRHLLRQKKFTNNWYYITRHHTTKIFELASITLKISAIKNDGPPFPLSSIHAEVQEKK